MDYYEVQRIYAVASSADRHWKIRFLFGSQTQTSLDAYNAGQFTDVIGRAPSNGNMIDVKLPRIVQGWWLKAIGWHFADNATLDFLIGIREYEE